MKRICGIKVGRIDWDSADFTYGQRLELGDIFGNEETSEYSKLCEAFKCMYGYSRKWLPMRLRIRVFDRILNGFKEWIEKEQAMLKYTPSSEEMSAGIQELSAKVGSMATIKQIAKSYSIDPDKVLEWPYAKVFAILYTDLEERKFDEKLRKSIYERNKH